MKFYKPIRILLAAGMLAVATSAGATDTTVDPSTSLQAQSPWQIRLRALGVIPRDSGRVDGIDDSGLSFSNTVIPELDVSYFLTTTLPWN